MRGVLYNKSFFFFYIDGLLTSALYSILSVKHPNSFLSMHVIVASKAAPQYINIHMYFLLFLAPAGGSNPASHLLTLT